MPASLTYRDVLKLLMDSGDYREFVDKGKGGHRMVCLYDDEGNKVACSPIPFHSKKLISRRVLGTLKRKFDLPKGFFESKSGSKARK